MDPKGQNLIPVVTCFDYYAKDVKDPKDGKQRIEEWENYYSGQLPYFLALHTLPNGNGVNPKAQFEKNLEEIKKMLEQNENESVELVTRDLPEYQTSLDHFKISALKDELDRRRNAVFQRNTTKILERMERRIEELTRLVSKKETELKEAQNANLENILSELADYYSFVFYNLYIGVPFKGSLEVKDQFECKWHTELNNFGNLKWPGKANAPVLKDPSICYKNTIDEANIAAHTLMSEMAISTGIQRVDRLKSYLGLKVTAIELTDPSDVFINVHLAASAGLHGMINPENAVRLNFLFANGRIGGQNGCYS
jgi:hypothetical protein